MYSKKLRMFGGLPILPFVPRTKSQITHALDRSSFPFWEKKIIDPQHLYKRVYLIEYPVQLVMTTEPVDRFSVFGKTKFGTASYAHIPFSYFCSEAQSNWTGAAAAGLWRTAKISKALQLDPIFRVGNRVSPIISRIVRSIARLLCVDATKWKRDAFLFRTKVARRWIFRMQRWLTNSSMRLDNYRYISCPDEILNETFRERRRFMTVYRLD